MPESVFSAVDVGDEVVHPHHGPGTVSGTETIDVGTGPTLYLVVTLPDGMTIKVPADSVEEVGLRDPVTDIRAEEVLTVLSQPPLEDPGHRVRRRRDSDKLASGRLIDCAEVVRDLTAVVDDHGKGGTHADLAMLARAREQLAAELAVALDISADAAMARVDDALSRRS
jgi:CarD family transcriptional regulator